MKRRRPDPNDRPTAASRTRGNDDRVPPIAPSRARDAAFAAIVFALVLAAYSPAFHSGFVWDDDAHVTANDTLLDRDGLRRIWFEPTSIPQYYPLVHTTFWLERRLWGLDPVGYHVLNALLHAVNAILVAAALRRLRVPGAWLAALLFALHPVQVESVAWITERKNVLSTLFYLAAALVLLRFFGFPRPGDGRRAGAGTFALGFGLFVAALFSKTVTASLPAALALVIVWKRRRLTKKEIGSLLPLAAAGAAFGLITIWLERHHVGAVGGAWDLGFVERVLIAGRAAWFYAAKLVWPANLCFVYPRWNVDRAAVAYAFPVAAVAALGVLWALRRKLGSGPFVALLFYWGTLVPALGFFDVYPMRYAFVADHFQYLASIGGFALVAAAATTAAARWSLADDGDRRLSRSNGALLGSAGIVLAVLGASTFNQARDYRDAETLWRATLVRNPEAPMARNNLGLILAQRGEADAAAEQYRQALAADPAFAEAEYNLANVLLKRGHIDEALRHYESAVASAPADPRARYNFAVALLRVGRSADAVPQLAAAVAAKPDFAAARGALAYGLAQLGREDEAIAEAYAALRVDPALMDTRFDLADWLAGRERYDDALAQYRAILEAEPDHFQARFNAGLALLRLGRAGEAVAEFDELLRRKPDFAEARSARADAAAQVDGSFRDR